MQFVNPVEGRDLSKAGVLAVADTKLHPFTKANMDKKYVG